MNIHLILMQMSPCTPLPECNWHPGSKGSSWHRRAWPTEAAGQGRNHRAHGPGAGSSVGIISSGQHNHLSDQACRQAHLICDLSVIFPRLLLTKPIKLYQIKRGGHLYWLGLCSNTSFISNQKGLHRFSHKFITRRKAKSILDLM